MAVELGNEKQDGCLGEQIQSDPNKIAGSKGAKGVEKKKNWEGGSD